jgi:hypothetical protein
MPTGRTWGSTSAVDIDRDGTSIWVAERCGANTCWDQAAGKSSPLDVVLKFDASGTLIRSFGAGTMVFPHGIHVDNDGNIWVTDGQDNLASARGLRPILAPAPPSRSSAIRFSVQSTGELRSASPAAISQDSQLIPRRSISRTMITNARGEIFVRDIQTRRQPES